MWNSDNSWFSISVSWRQCRADWELHLNPFSCDTGLDYIPTVSQYLVLTPNQFTVWEETAAVVCCCQRAALSSRVHFIDKDKFIFYNLRESSPFSEVPLINSAKYFSWKVQIIWKYNELLPPSWLCQNFSLHQLAGVTKTSVGGVNYTELGEKQWRKQKNVFEMNMRHHGVLTWVAAAMTPTVGSSRHWAVGSWCCL